MQTNDLNALSIPEGNVLSIYSNDFTNESKNVYPVANMFNPDAYEKETEVKIDKAVSKANTHLVGRTVTVTITLADSIVGTEGYMPIIYDRLNGVVINKKNVWTPGQKRGQAIGVVLWPTGKRVLDIYIITPEKKIIGPTSLEITVK